MVCSRRLSSSALFFKILMGIKTFERSFYMQNNIIDLLGFKDRDIVANITKSSPSSVEITVNKACKPAYCPVCNHKMYSMGPYVRTLNHPILQDGRRVTILLKQTTEPYFKSIPLKERARVKYLITDMYRPFEKYVSSYFPNAIHIVDSFHVIQLIIRHIWGYIRRRQRDIDERDRARHERIEQDIHRRFEFHHSRDYYIVKKYHWLITKNNSDIEYKQKPYYDTRMGRYMTTLDYEEALFKIGPVFKKLRDLKEVYIRFNNRYVGKPKEAAAGLRAVIQHYRNSDQKIFYKFIADTLEEYFDEIANSFIVVEKYSKDGKYAARLSNGPMESLNRIPKDLKRNARGYRNFEHIRQIFLFSQRSNAAVRANPRPLEEVMLKSNIKRGPYVKNAYRSDCVDNFF